MPRARFSALLVIVSRSSSGALVPRLPNHGEARRLRNDLAKELQPLGNQIGVNCGEPRDIPARPIEAGGKTEAHRIVDGCHDDRDRVGGALGGLGALGGMGGGMGGGMMGGGGMF